MSLIPNAGQLAEVLLDSALKGALVLASAWLTASCMRRRSAAARHLVWSLAVASLLLLPLLCWALPGWHILPHWMGVPRQPSPAVGGTAIQHQPEHRIAAAPQPLLSTEIAQVTSTIPLPAGGLPAPRDTTSTV
ncbi:MAG: hypothetical protein NT154_32435, partial [Verrucomicrobia bacterium]|nr:hypothetical protein [Verrucomicrobiota bacterium]